MGKEYRAKDGRRQSHKMDRGIEEQKGGYIFNVKVREEGRRKRMILGQAGDGQVILEENLLGNVDND
jgi:hypothetical protein